MRLFTGNSIIVLVTFGLLGMMAALVWLSDINVIEAQTLTPFIVEGKVTVDGTLVEDGAVIFAYVDGKEVAEERIHGGKFVMAIPEQPGQHLTNRAIEFAVKAPSGKLFDFPQKAIWRSGAVDSITLALLTGAKIEGNQRPAPVVIRAAPQFIVRGKVEIEGRQPPHGTRIVAFVGGVRMGNGAEVDGSEFKLIIQQPDGTNFNGQLVEFRAILPEGSRFRFPQNVDWRSGAQTFVSLEFHKPVRRLQPAPVEPSSPFGIPGISIPQLPDGIDIGCVMGVLGRIPSGPDDMSPQDKFRVAQECFSGGGFPDDSARMELEKLKIEQEKQQMEQELAFQREKQRFETQRIKDEQAFQQQQQRLEAEQRNREREFQLEQQRLDAEQRNREQERFKQEQALQEEQDRLDRDRLKSARERQIEQDRIDAERQKQDLDRLKADVQMQDQQQRLNQRRALEEQQRQDELEKARFESERARIDRERQLDEERARLDQERLIRDDDRRRMEEEINQRNREGQFAGGQQPWALDPVQSPDGAKALLGPSRGFFTNTRVGGLGAANQFMDPTMLAVIGILITMAATLMQMVKGS